MAISDEDLAERMSISVEQVGLLRRTRGATNDTLAGLSEAGIRRAVRGGHPARPEHGPAAR